MFCVGKKNPVCSVHLFQLVSSFHLPYKCFLIALKAGGKTHHRKRMVCEFARLALFFLLEFDVVVFIHTRIVFTSVSRHSLSLFHNFTWLMWHMISFLFSLFLSLGSLSAFWEDASALQALPELFELSGCSSACFGECLGIRVQSVQCARSVPAR